MSQLVGEGESLRSAATAKQVVLDSLEALRVSERRANQRLEQLSVVALELAGAKMLTEVAGIVICRGLPVLGAEGGAIAVIEEEEHSLSLHSGTCLGEHAMVQSSVHGLDELLPVSYVCRTGRPVLLPNRAGARNFSTQTAAQFHAAGEHAAAVVPMRIGGRLMGALLASWTTEHTFTPDETELLQAFAAQCAQAIDRIQTRLDQQLVAQQMQGLAEALQRSLLTQPPTAAALDIAVRYLPAAEGAQVGGDWYDAFDTTRGATLIAVGDVASHDRNAAASMAQLRNLMRGLSVDSDDGPARLLTRLDRAMDSLDLRAFATAVVARIDGGGMARAGTRVLRWSSAGHLPPMLRYPDGTVRVLASDADLLLGLDADTDRVEHRTDLPAGSVLVMYTDGLVERRGESLEEGLDRLAAALGRTGHAGPEATCDFLLDAMLPEAPEDDVAMLVLRTHV